MKALPEPSKIADLGNLTFRLVGLMMATGGLLVLLAESKESEKIEEK